MRLELRGLLFYFISYFTVEEHEGREALFRHGVAAAAFRGCFARLVSAAPARPLPPLGAQAYLRREQALRLLLLPGLASR